MKKQYLKMLCACAVLMCCPWQSFAQKCATSQRPTSAVKQGRTCLLEQYPQFPGGSLAMKQWLKNNVCYPFEAKQKGIQGRVTVSFYVEKDGNLSDIKIVKSTDSSFDKEALRVVGSMPPWIPGRLLGEVKRMKYTVPVVFQLEGSVVNEDVVYTTADVMPKFPGGNSALLDWLRNNVHYPKVAAEAHLQGCVVVCFIVEKDGSLTNVRAFKDYAPSLEKEAIRVVKSMPNWIPGRDGGKAVRVKYNIPVNFCLSYSFDK